jgi:threonine dehydratase
VTGTLDLVQLISLTDIQSAAARIADAVVRTPLIPARWADPARPLWIKPENLQPIGAFKIRGAYNALSQLSPAERAAGVVSHSSGNHAQGIARAARLLGIRALIVMPEDASAVKVAGVRADGAGIEFVSTDNEARITRAHELAERQGMVLVPSFDDARIIAGQGTVGLEIVEQLAETGRQGPLTVIVPIGGGGLSAGICVAVKGLRSDATVIGAEPELAADAAESLRQDRIVRWAPELTARTIADGARTSALGSIPFAHLRRLLDAVFTVSEDDIRAGMLAAAMHGRIVTEPTGALGIAAWSRHRAELPDAADTVIVVSGGNVDADVYLRSLAQAERLSSVGDVRP